MMKFACKDVGVNCDFVVTGTTAQEVKDKAMAHASVAHADLMKNMTKEQLEQMTKSVEASIKPT